jgi:hypothetical protein
VRFPRAYHRKCKHTSARRVEPKVLARAVGSRPGLVAPVVCPKCKEAVSPGHPNYPSIRP